MKLKTLCLYFAVLSLLCGTARIADAFDVRFINDFDRKMSVVISYFDGDSQKWQTRGWYSVEPHSTRKITLKSSKTTAYIYAELVGRSMTWGDGDISRTVISQAFSYYDGQNCPQGSNRRTIKLTKYSVKNGAIEFWPQGSAGDAPLEAAGDAYDEPEPANDADLSYELRKVTGEMISLVNKERRRAGVRPLIRDEKLCQAAQRRAYEIKDSFGHKRPDGRQAITVLKEYGISVNLWGENLEKDDAASIAYAHEAIFKSYSNRSNMLNAKFTHIGAGVFVQDGVYYWAQLYGDKPKPASNELYNKSLEESIDDFIRSLNELGDLFKK